MNKLEEARARLNDAIEARKKVAERISALADDAAEADVRALDDEFETAETTVTETRAAFDKLKRLDEARSAQPAPDADPIRVVREPLTYERGNLRDSYLIDLARTEFGKGDVPAARSRLQAHVREMGVELKARNERRSRVFDREMDSLLEELARNNPGAAAFLSRQQLVQKTEARAVSRVDGGVGEFVPPLWLLDEYAAVARAGRPFADACRNIPLPGGTDSISIPLISGGTLTGIQTADNQAVTSQDMTTTSVTAPVRTIAGQQDAALQLLDQSPIAYDEIVFADLLADYALQLDTQLINGSGINGQVLGILNVSGINTETYTDASPTLPELWPKLWEALNKGSNARKMPLTHWWWHSRRWYWASAQVDGNSRPFIVPTLAGPNNALVGVSNDAQNQNQSGPVGNVGAPIYLDLNIPTTLGGGTEDRCIATRMADHILFEGDVNVRVLKEVLSGTLGVRFQAYAYVAFTAARYPTGTTVVSGTGLVTPTF